MSIELKQVVEQSLDLSTPTLREMVTRHAAVIDSRATLEDMPEALAFQIDMARALLREFTAIQQAEAQQPATPEPVKAERDQLRCAQADAVMPLIGPLLDAWENADREVMSQEPELSKQLKNINSAMEDAQPATGEPVCQIRKAFTQDAEWAWRDATEEAFHMHPEKHRRILYTHQAPSVPDGHVLVPIEPTQAMMNVQTWDFSSFYSPREIWAAMLAAK